MSAFDFVNEKNTDDVEILKQTIEILKKDLLTCKYEIKRLTQIIDEQNDDRAIEILEYFNRCGNIRQTAAKYDMDMEYLYDMITEWDDGCRDGLQSADDYDECRTEVIGRQQWDEEQDDHDEIAIKFRNRTPNQEELDNIFNDYNSGDYELYEIADTHDLKINNLFRLLKEKGLIINETDAKRYAEFYVQHIGAGCDWDGKSNCNMID